MILTVTPNPMLDKTLFLERFPLGEISRTERVLNVAGGKGINVSRQLKFLGVDSLATGFLGGKIGEIIAGLLDAEGVSHDFVWVDGTTRIGFTVLETSTGIQTSVFEPGHKVTGEEVERLKDKVRSRLQAAQGKSRVEWLICSGTVPCSGMDDLYADMLRAARESNVPVILDTYGPPLRLAIGEKPFLVKPNVKEYLETFPHGDDPAPEKLSEDAAVEALRHLRDLGAKIAVISAGGSPAYASDGEHVWRAAPPAVTCVNPTGSGDAFIAGMVYGLSHCWEFEQSLRWGIAAGAANARRWEVACSSKEEISQLAADVLIERLC